MYESDARFEMNSPVLFVANWDWVLYNFRLPLARVLIEKGLQVILVCPPGKYTQEIQDMGFGWLPWDLSRRSTNPFSELFAISSLLQIYQKLKPKAVHHYTIKPIVYGSLAARLAKIEMVINNFTGLGYLFSDTPKANFWRRMVVPVLKIALRGPGFHTAFQNKFDQERLISLGIVKKEKTTIIPGTGVDISQFFPRSENAQATDPPVVLMAARLLWDKGVAEFVEAARLINQHGIRAHFWLAGEPDYGNPGSISAEMMAEWQQQGWVKLLGHRSDMPELIRQADIAVLPSRYLEGIPLFLLESAASGLTLIGSNIEGCRMVIEDGQNGFIIPEENTQSLVETLLKVIQDPEGRKRMGKASRKIAEQRFERQSILDTYLKLYTKTGVLG